MHDTPERAQFGPDIHGALVSGDGEALLTAVEMSQQDAVADTVGLRLQLRDFWVNRKADLSRLVGSADGSLVDEPAGSLDEAIRDVIKRADDELALLATPTDEDEAAEERANTRRRRLLNELHQKNPADRVAFLKTFEQLTRAQLSAPDELIEWTYGWRNVLVERLWDVVQDFREEGPSSEVNSSLHVESDTLNTIFDKLISGVAFRNVSQDQSGRAS